MEFCHANDDLINRYIYTQRILAEFNELQMDG